MGDNFAVPELSMEMVYVEPGTFNRGADNLGKAQKPLHKVKICHGFWMGKYPVTQEEYEYWTGRNPADFKLNKVLGLWSGWSQPWHPIESVSWHDAVIFCEQLTQFERQAGRLPADYEYRLPTEAEWEYAARGASKSQGYMYSGSDDIDRVAWYKGNSNGHTSRVGQKEPNELGIHDMSGNVNEWCLDWYSRCYYRSTPQKDPVNTTEGVRHVSRGGSWSSVAQKCRSAFRNKWHPSKTASFLGFRVALAPAVKPML